MSYQNYSLEIISHHPEFRNKSLRQYYLDGINTIGAYGSEEFEIKFKNNTWQKVQVKISIDGTDILTGEPANTEISKDMWVVNGYGTLSLKAWPETNGGGAAFVFTNANNSVAVHTHGDLSSRGIIAAAVFTESHVEPIKLNFPIVSDHCHHHYHYDKNYWPYVWPNTSPYQPYWVGGVIYNSNSITFQSSSSTSSIADSFSLSDTSGDTVFCNYAGEGNNSTKQLESLAAVGAGQFVDQKISYVPGLIKPLFTETVRVRFLWWDELVSKLKENHFPVPHASGFPGDKKQNIMSLGKTPRIGEFNKSTSSREKPVSYSRI